MTEQTDAAEVDVRATLLAALNDEYGDQGWDELRSLSRIVRTIAAREAAAKAEERERVAVAIEAMPLMDRWGYLDGKRLRDAALRIARTDGAGS